MRMALLFALSAVACFGASDTMTWTNVSGSSISNYPVQFGRVFAQGEIANYPQALVGGSTVTTQANVHTRWPDGSVKHATITFFLAGPIANNNAVAFTFQNQTGCNCGSGVRETQAGMLGSGYDLDAQIQATQSSVTKTTSIRSILTAWDGVSNGYTGPVQFWNDGSVSTTVIVADHSATHANDFGWDSYAPLRPIFQVTFWPSLHLAQVRFVVEASNPLALENETYSLILTTGYAAPTTVFTAASVAQGSLTRWTKSGYWVGTGTAPSSQVNLDHNIAYLAATTAFPNYDTTKTVSSTQISADYTAWQASTLGLYQRSLWQNLMGTVGGRPDIGPNPAWAVKWMYTGDWRERVITLDEAERVGFWSIHVRESDPARHIDQAGTIPALGHPDTNTARPSVDWSQGMSQPNATVGDKIVPVGTACALTCAISGLTWTWDASHLPMWAPAAYLLTGDYYFLDEAEFWVGWSSMYPVASTAVSWGRGPTLTSGMVYAGEQRAQAWGIAERAEAAALVPDGTPEQALYEQWIADMVAIWDGVHNLTDSVYYNNTAWQWGRNTMVTNAGWGISKVLPPLGQWWKSTSAFVDSEQATLSAPILSTDLSFTVSSTTLPASGVKMIVLDNEAICVSISGSTLTVVKTCGAGTPSANGRGWNATTPVAHAAGAILNASGQAAYGIDPNMDYEASSGYEQHYMGYAFGRTSELGFPAINTLWKDVLAVWYNNLLNDPTFNPYLIACGRIPTTKLSDHTYYTTMASLLTGYLQSLALSQAWGAGTTNVWATMNTVNLTDPELGYAYLGSASVSYMTPYAGGVAAWAWASSHIETASTYLDNPKWALLPRTLGSGGSALGGKATAGGMVSH
jgi:hypothetical protein